MLRPLVWQGILIPVLPALMMDCLDAPIPIVLGLQTFPEHRSDALSELFVVDVDNNVSVRPRNNWEDLPDRKQLCASSLAWYSLEIVLNVAIYREAALEPYHKKLYTRHKQERPLNPCRTNASEIEIVRCITKVFRKYVDKFLDSFRSAIIEKNLDIGSTNFETKIMDVVPQLPKNFRVRTTRLHFVDLPGLNDVIDCIQKFATLFFQTQQFNFYSEKFIKSVKKKRDDDSQLYQRMSALIKLEEDERTQLEQKRNSLSILSSADRTERDRLDKLIRVLFTSNALDLIPSDPFDRHLKLELLT